MAANQLLGSIFRAAANRLNQVAVGRVPAERPWGTILLLIGRADPSVASLEAHYADGRAVPAALRDGVWVLDLPTPNDPEATPEVPSSLVATDSAGNVTAKAATDAIRANTATVVQGTADFAAGYEAPKP